MSITQVGPNLISSVAGVSGSGKLLQTITTVKLDVFSATATSMTDVTGLSVFAGSAGNYAMCTLPISILDSPSSTSELTYKVQCEVYSGSAYINRSERDDDNAAGYDGRGSSSITVQEIGA